MKHRKYVGSIPHKTLDFVPDHAYLIYTQTKTRTFRLGDKVNDYDIGDIVTLTVLGMPITRVKIVNVEIKYASEFTLMDLKGTEFKNLEEACNSLRSVYFVEHIPQDELITIIDWKYIEEYIEE